MKAGCVILVALFLVACGDAPTPDGTPPSTETVPEAPTDTAGRLVWALANRDEEMFVACWLGPDELEECFRLFLPGQAVTPEMMAKEKEVRLKVRRFARNAYANLQTYIDQEKIDRPAIRLVEMRRQIREFLRAGDEEIISADHLNVVLDAAGRSWTIGIRGGVYFGGRWRFGGDPAYLREPGKQDLAILFEDLVR